MADKRDKRLRGYKDKSLDNNNLSANEFEDEIDLRELFDALWSGKIKIIVITAVFAVASVIYALSLIHI